MGAKHLLQDRIAIRFHPHAKRHTMGKVKEQAKPCDSPCFRVISYEMLWANAVLVLEKAKPANKLARLAKVLSATLLGLSSSSGKWRTTVCAACRAKPSDTGFAFIFQMASKACDKASKLLSRVTVCGKDKVKAGSTKAASGQVCAKCKEYF